MKLSAESRWHAWSGPILVRYSNSTWRCLHIINSPEELLKDFTLTKKVKLGRMAGLFYFPSHSSVQFLTQI